MRMHGVWINGQGRPGRGEDVNLVEPFSGQPFLTYQQGNEADLDEAVEQAAAAFRDSGWRGAVPLQRQRVLHKAADLMRDAAEELGRIEARNIGRPFRETRANAGLAADAFDYFASVSTHIRGASIPMGDGLFDYTIREPHGVCGLITPWNNPLVLSSWKIAAGLAAGNALVIKPASLTPVTAIRMAEILTEAGLPDGQMNVVTGSGAKVGDRLVTHTGVRKISFTGSTPIGKNVLRVASERLARVTLELGGKSPSIVFSDADLDAALSGSIPAMFGNAGQMCTARSRIFVHRDVAAEFTDRLVSKVSVMRLGSPFDETTDLGPVISQAQLDTVRGFIDRAEAEGATIATGGVTALEEPGVSDGFFVRPTVLTDVADSMEAVREEIFGPVLVIDEFDSEDEVVARSNQSPFGLAATIWTRDLARAHRVAGALESGTVTVNTTKVSHVYAPFGGVKESGIGRELGLEGIDAFLETKNVILAIPPAG